MKIDNLPKISIITPSYNQAPYIEETIRSVLLQDYPSLEYIIIDGGSTDGSVEIIKKYEPRLAYWVSETDRGQAHAINKGFERASGEIFAWINSDDTYQPGALLQAATIFQKNPDYSVIYGNVNLVAQDGSLVSHEKPPGFLPPKIFTDHIIPQPSSFFRRGVVEEYGPLIENLHFCMDYEFWLRIGAKDFIGYFDQTFSNFRMHSQSKSSNLDTLRWDETINILDQLFQRKDLPTSWLKYAGYAKGVVHWHASIANYLAGKYERSKGLAVEACNFSQSYISSKAFSSYFVGNTPVKVEENNLDFYKKFFELVPDHIPSKKKALKVVMARYFALLALKPNIPPGKSRVFSRKAIFLDSYWLHNRYLLKNLLLPL